jgi:hypothetical protein
VGVNSLWQDEVLLTIQAIHPQALVLDKQPYYIINCNASFYINLIPLENTFKPDELVQLQVDFQKQGIFLIHIWEDVWLTKKQQISSRIHSFLGLNTSFHGRKAKVVSLSITEITNFLNTYHLQGYIKAKYNFGLVANGEIIAAANFSDTRPMKDKGDDYLSAELVRFASKDGLTIVGGLSKVIKHFLKEVKVNDLMTYADRDWSIGKGYDKLGFELTAITEPAFLYLDQKSLIRYFPHRLPKNVLSDFENQDILNLEDYLAANNYVKLFNTGNLKYHLYQ